MRSVVTVPDRMPRSAFRTSGIKRLVLLVFVVGLGGCAEVGLTPGCVIAGSDVMTKVSMGCRLSKEEQKAFDAEIDRRQKAAAAYEVARWEANNPGKCPPRLTQKYDYDLSGQYTNFMQLSQFAIVSDGFGRGVRRVYVPSAFGDQMLARMQATMKERDEMCRKAGYQPYGFIPPIFGQGV